MTFEEAVDILFIALGEELLSFEGIDSLNNEGEFEFKVIKKYNIRQKIHIGPNRIFYKMPEDYLDFF
jgi:hypothetical protein